MTPMDLAEARAYCICGAWLESDTQDRLLAHGLVDVFWAAHSTAGHAPATSAAARLVRQRREREAMEAWTG